MVVRAARSLRRVHPKCSANPENFHNFGGNRCRLDEVSGIMYQVGKSGNIGPHAAMGTLVPHRPRMANRLRIRLNWPLLIANMSKQEGRDMTRGEVEQWLRDAGFRQEGDESWIVNEPDLGQLDPEEVISCEDA